MKNLRRIYPQGFQYTEIGAVQVSESQNDLLELVSKREPGVVFRPLLSMDDDFAPCYAALTRTRHFFKEWSDDDEECILFACESILLSEKKRRQFGIQDTPLQYLTLLQRFYFPDLVAAVNTGTTLDQLL